MTTITSRQRRAERNMIDTGEGSRPTGATTTDPNTGSETPVYAALFTSKCKVQSRQVVVQSTEAGGRTVTSVRLELQLPVGAAPLKSGDLWTITAVGAGSGTVLGRKLRIGGPVDKTFATAMRYEVTEVVA